MLHIEHLAFAHPGRPLWNGLSAHWPAGVVLVQGGDGSGKSTLLRLLAGTLAPHGGSVRLGDGPQALDAATPAPWRDAVFWIDPRTGLPDDPVVADWAASLPARWPRWDAAAWAAHVQGFGLAPHLGKPFHQLSTGSQRKAWMAAALASGAALVLIDEPVAGLDKPSVAYLQQALRAVAEAPAGRTVVVAHYEALPLVPWTTVATLD